MSVISLSDLFRTRPEIIAHTKTCAHPLGRTDPNQVALIRCIFVGSRVGTRLMVDGDMRVTDKLNGLKISRLSKPGRYANTERNALLAKLSSPAKPKDIAAAMLASEIRACLGPLRHGGIASLCGLATGELDGLSKRAAR